MYSSNSSNLSGPLSKAEGNEIHAPTTFVCDKFPLCMAPICGTDMCDSSSTIKNLRNNRARWRVSLSHGIKITNVALIPLQYPVPAKFQSYSVRVLRRSASSPSPSPAVVSHGHQARRILPQPLNFCFRGHRVLSRKM